MCKGRIQRIPKKKKKKDARTWVVVEMESQFTRSVVCHISPLSELEPPAAHTSVAPTMRTGIRPLPPPLGT